ncbi:DnaB-like helicase N-terminal domain-containing protein, partial [Dysosmobacter sp.]|uniref:DnaB-like helicase N-terminal domain-containing protein n=1 Tax=Dysosmobacter sp. TaxID=2591382 RepID=UPI002620B056
MAMSSQEKLDHQLDAERAVIGSMLIDPEIVRDVLSTVDVRDFLNPTTRLIFQAARKLFRDGKTVDRFSIRDQVGSQYSDYMVQLMDITPTSAN